MWPWEDSFFSLIKCHKSYWLPYESLSIHNSYSVRIFQHLFASKSNNDIYIFFWYQNFVTKCTPTSSSKKRAIWFGDFVFGANNLLFIRSGLSITSHKNRVFIWWQMVFHFDFAHLKCAENFLLWNWSQFISAYSFTNHSNIRPNPIKLFTLQLD